MEKRGRKKSGGSIRGKRRYKRNTKESLKRDLANAFADCMQPVAPSRTHQSKLLRYARRYSSPLGASKRSSRRSAREISKGRPKSRGKTKKALRPPREIFSKNLFSSSPFVVLRPVAEKHWRNRASSVPISLEFIIYFWRRSFRC